MRRPTRVSGSGTCQVLRKYCLGSVVKPARRSRRRRALQNYYVSYWPVINQYWIAGAASSILFFLSVLIHELSHTFMAQHYGMKVPSITLFAMLSSSVGPA